MNPEPRTKPHTSKHFIVLRTRNEGANRSETCAKDLVILRKNGFDSSVGGYVEIFDVAEAIAVKVENQELTWIRRDDLPVVTAVSRATAS
jgi:hypothetical protein